jgi:hypothetical protein
VKSAPLHIDIEYFVEMPFRDSFKRSHFRQAGVGEDDIDRPVSSDSFVEPVKIGQTGDVPLNAEDVVTDLVHGVVELLPLPSHDEDIRTFCDEEFCRGKSDPGRTPGDDRHFALQLAHAYRSRSQCLR